MSPVTRGALPKRGVYTFQFIHYGNNTITVNGWASDLSPNGTGPQPPVPPGASTPPPPEGSYDTVGAMYYVVAVIIMFSFTILAMFRSLVRRGSEQDNSLLSYMKDVHRLEKLQMKQEKFRTKLKMHQKKVHRILGPDRAEVLADEQTTCSCSRTPSPTSPGAGSFTWERDELLTAERRPSCSSLGTIIVCAKDLRDDDLFIPSRSPKTRPVVPKQHRRLSAPATNLCSIHGHNNPFFGESFELGAKRAGRKTAVHFSSIPEVRIQTCD
jgi:hypothetical protein